MDWCPDEMLVPAVLCGGASARPMSELSPPDRSWAVAGLIRAGLTAESIADRMKCSLRLVRTIKAEPMTTLAAMMQDESATFAAELRLLRSEHTAALARARRAEAERDTARAAVARLVDAARSTACTAGHAMTAYNTYTDRAGRRFCRECHRLRQARYRARRASPSPESTTAR